MYTEIILYAIKCHQMYSFFVAKRYIWSKKDSGFTSLATWLSFFGIAIGVAALIIVTSVMNGFKVELLNKYSMARGHIVVKSSRKNHITNYKNILKSTNNIQEVVYAIPILETEALVIKDKVTRGIVVCGMDKAGLIDKKFISGGLDNIAIDNFKDCVFISARMSNILNVGVGDEVTLFVPNAKNTPLGPMPFEDVFRVGGIFDTGLYEYDCHYVLMPLDTLQNFLDLDDEISSVEILLKNSKNVNSVGKEIANNNNDYLKIMSFSHENNGMLQVLRVQKNILSLILFIIILVAAFNIISSLTMLSNSKNKDIAILRTIGATRLSVLSIFLMIGCMIGFGGTFLGIVLGVVIGRNISDIQAYIEGLLGYEIFDDSYFISSRLPCALEYSTVVQISIAAIVICILAAIYPAIKSSHVDPVKVLKS